MVLAKRLYILIAFILTGDIIFHCPMLKEYLRDVAMSKGGFTGKGLFATILILDC